jgi:hypothetical protein
MFRCSGPELLCAFKWVSGMYAAVHQAGDNWLRPLHCSISLATLCLIPRCCHHMTDADKTYVN